MKSYLEFDFGNEIIKLKSYNFWLQESVREFKFSDIILIFGGLQGKQYHIHLRTASFETVEIPNEIWQNYFQIKKIQESLFQAKIAQHIQLPFTTFVGLFVSIMVAFLFWFCFFYVIANPVYQITWSNILFY